MLSFDKFDDQKENVEIKSKEDDTVGTKNIEENEEENRKAENMKSCDHVQNIAVRLVSKEENFQTTISPSRFSNGGRVKSKKTSQIKEKNRKSVKSIVEIFETFQRGNKTCKKNEEKMQFLQNTVKNDRIEGDGFARVMKNIKNKANWSSPKKALTPKLKRLKPAQLKVSSSNKITRYLIPKQSSTNQKTGGDHVTINKDLSQSQNSDYLIHQNKNSAIVCQSNFARDKNTTEEVP